MINQGLNALKKYCTIIESCNYNLFITHPVNPVDPVEKFLSV